MGIKLTPDELIGAAKWHIHREYGSVSDAGEKLGIPQSNLSVALGGGGNGLPEKLLNDMGLSKVTSFVTN